jgi:hypothetical protein
MKPSAVLRLVQIANVPVLLVAVLFTFGSVFGLNSNEGLTFYLFLLAPIWIVLWLAIAKQFENELPLLAIALSALPPLGLVGILSLVLGPEL